MQKITELFAFICIENEEGDEGIIACEMPNKYMMPFIGGDMARINDLKPLADQICKYENKKYIIKRFKFVGEIDAASFIPNGDSND